MIHPNVTLSPSNVVLHNKLGPTGSTRSMHYALNPTLLDVVELDTGPVFASIIHFQGREHLEAELSVRPRTPHNAIDAFGEVVYHPGQTVEGTLRPGTLSFSINLTPSDFKALWNAAILKVLPTDITFEIAGLAYATSSEGPHKRWNVSLKRRLFIESIGWTLRVAK